MKFIGRVVAFLALVFAANAATISVLPSDQSVSVGASVMIGAEITGLSPDSPSVGSFDIDIGFDNSVLAFSSAAFGTNLDLFGLGSVRLVSPGIGEVNLIEVSLETPDDIDSLQLNSFLLFSVTFTALKSGTTPLKLTLNTLGDADGAALTSGTNDAHVTVIDTVPEPSSWIMVLGGLAILVRQARRRA